MKTQLTALLLALPLLGLVALGASAATAQTELFFATGVDSTGWAQAQSNADGHVLIESPQYPRGLWLQLVDEAGDALAGLQVEYQSRPDSLVAIRCVDPAGDVQETLVWTRPDGTPLSLTLKPKEAADLPAGLASIDWQIDSGTIYLLKPVEKARLGWEGLAAFMRKRWQGQDGRVAVQLDAEISLAIEVDHPEAAETIVAYLQQLHQSAGDTFVESTALKLQVFKGSLTLLEGVILFISYFEDAVLEVVVRRELRRPRGPITRQEISSLTNFEASSKGIHSLSGLEHFTALQRLELYDNRIADISPLAQLKNLTVLNLGYNHRIADITPLAQLENLNTLWLGNNRIADLSPLARLKNLNTLYLGFNQMRNRLSPLAQLENLTVLNLRYNRIADITPLAQLENLNTLYLFSNQIADITPLAQLENLNTLWLGNNRIADLSPLARLKNLTVLNLRNNRITDITPLAQLENLNTLWLGNNKIKDLSPLVTNFGLSEGDVVNLYDNPLSNQAHSEQIPALKARGVRVSH